MSKGRVVSLFAGVALLATAMPPSASAAPHRKPGVVKTLQIPARACGPTDSETCIEHPAATVQVGAAKQLQQVATDPCPKAALDGATCGHIDVPLERDPPNNANEQMIPIGYELYMHSNAGPAEGVILPNFGGPGSSTTSLRDLALFLFADSLGTHDLLLIDDRGTGTSGRVECPELVLAISAPFEELLDAMSTCAASLGDAADDYSTPDMAYDTEELLTELGYEQADFYGLSYGGMKLYAFAARFPGMVRSMVFDSPSGPTETRPLDFGQARTSTIIPKIVAQCARSKTCSSQVPDPAAELTSLIERVRANPVDGSFNTFGKRRSGNVNEKQLLEIMSAPLVYLTNGELPGAAMAQRQGDDRPLIRASAEINGAQAEVPIEVPRQGTSGAALATLCADTEELWDWDDMVAERVAAFEAARDALPNDWYAPFSKDSASNYIFDFTSLQCAGWAMPDEAEPLIPDGADFPDSPVIALEGEMDPVVPHAIVDDVTEFFPNATLYVVKNSFHTVAGAFQSACVDGPMNAFIVTLQPPVTICEPPALYFPAKGEFYGSVSDADLSTVRLRSTNEAGRKAQKTALAAGRSAVDVFLRSIFGVGDCLRSGTFRTRFTASPPAVKFNDCSVVPGVVLNGKVKWGWVFYGADGSVAGDLTVSGTGAVHGTLHLAGSYFSGAQKGRIRVRGDLGGKKVALSFPSN